MLGKPDGGAHHWPRLTPERVAQRVRALLAAIRHPHRGKDRVVVKVEPGNGGADGTRWLGRIRGAMNAQYDRHIQ